MDKEVQDALFKIIARIEREADDLPVDQYQSLLEMLKEDIEVRLKNIKPEVEKKMADLR